MTQVTLPEVPNALVSAFAAGDPSCDAKVAERMHVVRMGQMFQAIASGDFDAVRGHLAPDATLEIVAPPGLPWVCHARGADEVAAAIAANFRALRDQRPEQLSLVAQGDTIMVMARETGRMADSGEPYTVLLSQQYTFRAGQLAVFRSVAGYLDGAAGGGDAGYEAATAGAD